MVITMYWIFEKVNNRLKELGECLFACSRNDAIESARRKFHFTGDLVAVSDRAMYPMDYVGIQGGIDTIPPQKQGRSRYGKREKRQI